jgi:Cu/Ag efflux protein CusF
MRAVLFLALAAFVGLGCAPAKPEQHSTTGVIDEIKAGGQAATITHEAFPGFMEGMTMTFQSADPALFKGLKAKDKVRFTITKAGDDWKITAVQKIP